MDGTFSQVVFASYGNPSGNNGEYTQGWCHSTNSILKVSKEFVGKSTATIGASNGLFGDPCGGTYKRLYIVLKYTGGTPNVPTTTTTTTLPPPTCGPYENINVTGKLNGSVWGSGPYTDDSDMGVAAVHAGLVSVGETATLVPTNVAYHLSYPGSTLNGVTTTDWLSGWCGFDLTLFVPETTTTSTIPETTTTTEPETVVPETTTTTTEPDSPSTTDVVTDPDPDPAPETTVPDTVPNEAETPANTEPETQPNNNETVEVTADNLAEVLSGEITSEEVGAVVDAITSGDIEITDEVADQLVDVLTSGEATQEQIVELVDALIEQEKIDPEVAAELATSAEVLESITEEQATEIFAAIETSEITEEEKSEITEAVQNAPEEVKNAFEEEINIYADGFDDYVPVGSVIDVGTRRSLIAATTVLSTVAVAGASGGSSGGGGGSPSSRPSPSGGGSGGPDPNSAAKKEDEPEEEEEEAAEIEGPEGDEEENSFTRNSIYKYQEGTMKRTFNPWGFIKKFAKETAALAFTISGTVIVFATLSGDTRKITLIATSCAFVVHYLNAMLKNDE